MSDIENPPDMTNRIQRSKKCHISDFQHLITTQIPLMEIKKIKTCDVEDA